MSKKRVSKSRTDQAGASTSGFSVIERKLDLVLKNQAKLMAEESKIEKEAKKIEVLENSELAIESANGLKEDGEMSELKKIEALEAELKTDIENISPIKKITYKDVTKGMIGAFFGTVSHYAFVKGSDLGLHYSVQRSTVMYIASFCILVAFLYFAGFRKITDDVKYKFLPLRAVVIYTSAIITSYLVLLLFDTIQFTTDITEMYRMLSPISVLAVLGAATADLIGKNEDD